MKKKRPVEDYETLALYIYTAQELLFQAANIYGRAAFTDKMLRIDSKLQLLNYKVGEEMEKDYPEMIGGWNPFFDKSFELIKRQDHIYSAYKRKGGEAHETDGGIQILR